ncbi:MAG: hypothetical protein ACQKBW_01345 [Puniceicoccales bacterium]
MKSIRCLLLPSIVILLALLAGCASPKATLKYTPVAAVPTIYNTTEAAPRIAVVDFSYPQSEMGEAKFTVFNTWDMEVDEILSDDDLGLIFAEATVDALRKSGVQADVLTLSEYQATANVYDGLLTGNIQTAEIHLKAGWGTVGITAQTTTLITLEMHGMTQTYGPIISGSSQSGSGYNIHSQYSLAIDGSIQDYVRQFIRLMKTENAF